MEHLAKSPQLPMDPEQPERSLIVILFWSSNPIDSKPSSLDEEVRSIRERLGPGKHIDHFDLRKQWAIGISDMAEGLLRHRPTIVHFSGYDNPAGEIIIERPDGTPGPVSATALARLFTAFATEGTGPRCVVFNACYSESLAEALNEHVDCVVGTPATSGYPAASAFAAGFYRALGDGHSVAAAFDSGSREMGVSNQDEKAAPRLQSRVDPNLAHLIDWDHQMSPSPPDEPQPVGTAAESEVVKDGSVGGEDRPTSLRRLRAPRHERATGRGTPRRERPVFRRLGVPRREDSEPSPPGATSGHDTLKEPWNLETRFPREVVVGSTTSLVVELTKEASSDRDSSILPVNLEAGTTVGVVVQAKQGFEVEGPAEGTVTATVDSLPIRFQLRATAVGSGLVRVLFFVEATALGAITLQPVILAADDSPDHTAVPSSEVVSALSVGPGRPDLELLVLEEASTGRPTYSIRVTASDESLGIHLREFGPIELHTDARHYFADMFVDIEALDLSTPDDRARAQRLLESRGNHLFSTLLPPQLQHLLWDIRHRITRVRIDSEEPYIPWELIRLSGPGEDGTIVEDRFLCEYEVTRWIPGLGLNSRLTLGDFGVVIPEDSELASAQEEKTFLAGLATPRRRITQVPAVFDAVMEALAAGTHDVWHFSGHGSVKDTQDPNRASMELSDGQRLTPEQISGVQANLGRASPLVFLNACQIGRAAMSLTGLGGWARQFLHAGASSFVGAMWNVHDNPARDFAQTFYTRLLEGATIGAATLEARNEIKQYQDATWLAYTVYGHPSAALATESR